MITGCNMLGSAELGVTGDGEEELDSIKKENVYTHSDLFVTVKDLRWKRSGVRKNDWSRGSTNCFTLEASYVWIKNVLGTSSIIGSQGFFDLFVKEHVLKHPGGRAPRLNVQSASFFSTKNLTCRKPTVFTRLKSKSLRETSKDHGRRGRESFAQNA